MGGDDDAFVDACAEFAHAFRGCLARDTFLVAARRPVAEADAPEAFDLEGHSLLEAAEEVAHLRGVMRLHPTLALGLGAVFEQRPVRVAADEAGVQAAHEVERLRGKRAPRQIAAEDDEVRPLALELGQDGLERRHVAVYVREHGDLAQIGHRYTVPVRGYSSAGRAPGSHPGGRRFESG
jgi:hypothetical protein